MQSHYYITITFTINRCQRGRGRGRSPSPRHSRSAAHLVQLPEHVLREFRRGQVLLRLLQTDALAGVDVEAVHLSHAAPERTEDGDERVLDMGRGLVTRDLLHDEGAADEVEAPHELHRVHLAESLILHTTHSVSAALPLGVTYGTHDYPSVFVPLMIFPKIIFLLILGNSTNRDNLWITCG